MSVQKKDRQKQRELFEKFKNNESMTFRDAYINNGLFYSLMRAMKEEQAE